MPERGQGGAPPPQSVTPVAPPIPTRPNDEICHPNPCQNGGTCRAHRVGYKCTCPVGYSGGHCQGIFTTFSSSFSCERFEILSLYS